MQGGWLTDVRTHAHTQTKKNEQIIFTGFNGKNKKVK